MRVVYSLLFMCSLYLYTTFILLHLYTYILEVWLMYAIHIYTGGCFTMAACWPSCHICSNYTRYACICRTPYTKMSAYIVHNDICTVCRCGRPVNCAYLPSWLDRYTYIHYITFSHCMHYPSFYATQFFIFTLLLIYTIYATI